MKGLLLVLVVLGLGVGMLIIYTTRADPAQSSALPTRIPTQVPYPPPNYPPPPPRPPERTLVIPTPRPPITTTAQITRELAIAKAMNFDPNNVALLASGQLTVTATLTTYGAYSGRGIDTSHTPFHPSLPVWVVEIETKPWTQWSGPVGNQVQLTFRGFRYVIDAVTGEVLVTGSRILAGEKK